MGRLSTTECTYLPTSYTNYCGTSIRTVKEHVCAQALTQAYHFYTHMLLGVDHEMYTHPSGPPVRKQENTTLLSCCGLAGTSKHVALLGLGQKECSVCVHSV